MTATIDQAQCTSCSECVSTCPVEAISQQTDKDDKAVVDEGTCVDCGACVDACPVSAISL